MDKRTRKELITCFVLLFILIFYHHLDKYLPWWLWLPCNILIPITLIALLVYLVNDVIWLIRNRKIATFKSSISTIVVLITLSYTIFSPVRLDSENLESPVAFRACYEGTQNQSVIKFRTDNSFEINSTGAFFSNYWYLGGWQKHGDTLFMKFDKENARLLSDTIIIYNEHLIPLDLFVQPDSVRWRHVYYYLGYCRGEN